jgi:hypothetical protein
MKNIGYVILRIFLDIESLHFKVDKINQKKIPQKSVLEIFYITSQLDTWIRVIILKVLLFLFHWKLTHVNDVFPSSWIDSNVNPKWKQ